MDKIRRWLFRFWRGIRYRYCLRLLDPTAKTLADLGDSDGGFAVLARRSGYEAVSSGVENDIARATTRADIITCFEVLEHLADPAAAIKNLAVLYGKQLIVSVPNEPWFSVWRLSWEPEHLWAVTPAILKHYLGAPVFETRIVLNRYYVAVWKKA
jgi:hypothetical protein